MAELHKYIWSDVFAQMGEDDHANTLQDELFGQLSFDSPVLEDVDGDMLSKDYKIIFYQINDSIDKSAGSRQLIAEPLKDNAPWILLNWDWDEQNLTGDLIKLSSYVYNSYEDIFDDTSLVHSLKKAALGLREEQVEKYLRNLIESTEPSPQKPRL